MNSPQKCRRCGKPTRCPNGFLIASDGTCCPAHEVDDAAVLKSRAECLPRYPVRSPQP